MEPIDEAIEALRRAGIDFACALPCVSIKGLIESVESSFPTYRITREEEGVGICAGAHLAGRRPMMLIQNSGLGNMVNALKSLVELYEIPLLLIMSHRGQDNEWIDGQRPMGEAAEPVLEALGIEFFHAAELGIGEAIGRGASSARERGRASAVLVRPGVLS